MYQRRKDDPLRGLDHSTRKRVRRAVRRGQAVHDPREARHAAAYADVIATRENPIPLGLPVVVALLGAAAAAVLTGLIRPFWLLPFAVAVLVRPIQARIVAKAKAAAAANRALAVETGVRVPEAPAPEPAWHGVTPWGLAALIILLFAAHLGIRAFDSGEDVQALPPQRAEPAPAQDDFVWYANAEYRCRQAAGAIEALSTRNPAEFKARRLEIRARTVQALAAAPSPVPPRAHFALTHLDQALRHERRAVRLERKRRPAAKEWRAAARDATMSTSRLETLGVHACSATFG